MIANSQTFMRPGALRRFSSMRIRSLGAVLTAAAMLAACKTSDLNITNPNVVTVAGAATDPLAVQLLATGLLSDHRGNTTG